MNVYGRYRNHGWIRPFKVPRLHCLVLSVSDEIELLTKQDMEVVRFMFEEDCHFASGMIYIDNVDSFECLWVNFSFNFIK